MKTILSFGLCLAFCLAGCSQNSPRQTSANRKVGGPCDGCELIYEGMPTELSWHTNVAAPGEPGEPLIISGTIYQQDGQTPAAGVIYYVYHTDNTGRYSPSPNQSLGRRHGHLRGWMKTNTSGQYEFKTIRPAAYPNNKIPAHIHPSVKEPGLSEYYIDEYLFEGDPFLTDEERARQPGRGGSGIIRLTINEKGEWIGHRDIVLGRNIPDY